MATTTNIISDHKFERWFVEWRGRCDSLSRGCDSHFIECKQRWSLGERGRGWRGTGYYPEFLYCQSVKTEKFLLDILSGSLQPYLTISGVILIDWAGPDNCQYLGSQHIATCHQSWKLWTLLFMRSKYTLSFSSFVSPHLASSEEL